MKRKKKGKSATPKPAPKLRVGAVAKVVVRGVGKCSPELVARRSPRLEAEQLKKAQKEAVAEQKRLRKLKLAKAKKEASGTRYFLKGFDPDDDLSGDLLDSGEEAEGDEGDETEDESH